MRAAPEDAAVLRHRQHDGDGIGAREMVRRTGIAVAAITGVGDLGLGAAIGAEAVALVPMKKRARLRQETQLARRQKPLDGD